MKAIIPLFAITIFSNLLIDEAQSGERVNLVLRAFVPPAISTRISHIQLSSTSSLVKFSSHVNSDHIKESQKFEVEGLDQPGLSGKIELIGGTGRSISYELLVKNLNTSLSKDRPIFLKISAN